MPQPVVHVEVIGSEPDRLREYYGTLFGWQFGEPMGPTNYSVAQDSDGVGRGVGGVPEAYPGHVTFYVQVENVENTLAQAEALGGQRMMGPEDISEVGITLGLLSDPEGHVIGVMTPLDAG